MGVINLIVSFATAYTKYDNSDWEEGIYHWNQIIEDTGIYWLKGWVVIAAVAVICVFVDQIYQLLYSMD